MVALVFDATKVKPLNSKQLRRLTLKARKRAHEIFDPLWLQGPLSRGFAYELLALELGLTQSECHMSKMSIDCAAQVEDAVRRIWEKINATPCQTKTGRKAR